MNNHKKFILLMVVLFNLILPLNAFGQNTQELEQGQATVRQAIKSGNKDFFTIVTPNNTTYYLVIDYDNNNKNVYFLKAVDEVDLIDLAGVNEIIYNQDTEEPSTEILSEEVTEESSLDESENEIQEDVIELQNEKMDFFSIIAMVGLIALIIYIIYSKIKGKSKTDTLDYDDDEYIEDDEEPIANTEDIVEEQNLEETDFIKSLANKKDRNE